METTGTHKLSLFLIDKSEHPLAYKNINTLHMVYKQQPKAWMTADVFLNCYNTFIPDVIMYQKEMGGVDKTLLIIDNALRHHLAIFRQYHMVMDNFKW